MHNTLTSLNHSFYIHTARFTVKSLLIYGLSFSGNGIFEWNIILFCKGKVKNKQKKQNKSKPCILDLCFSSLSPLNVKDNFTLKTSVPHKMTVFALRWRLRQGSDNNMVQQHPEAKRLGSHCATFVCEQETATLCSLVGE